ncbi:PREDICTED: X-ray repair cross-complementing protein 5-like isoform X2 [Papilio polytes]|nr:PREDICTED: X-ray repair cross-complementing protein 5-like isoform X2 [Papilio polytes]
MESINKRIILITNFMTPSDIPEDKKEKIKNKLYKENIQVDVIGCDLFEKPSTNSDKNLAQKIVKNTNGVSILFDDAMEQLIFYKKKHVTGNPWMVDLCIGPNIAIPIHSYIRTKSEKPLKTWIEVIRDPISDRASTVQVKKNTFYINADNKVVNKKDVVKGVHYGETIIPFSVIDKKLNCVTESKSLNIYGFTSAARIKWENLNYDNLSYIYGCKGDKNACNAIKCLAECLMERNLVAIARGIKKRDSPPRMYALMPVQEGKTHHLSMIGICFKEEIRHMLFPQTDCEKYICSNEQIDAFKDLIKAMNLNNDDLDDSERFDISKVPSPSVQYAYDSVVFRAKNPFKPLPKPRDEISNLLQVPNLIKMKATDAIEKMKSVFVLNKINDNQKDDSEPMEGADELNITENMDSIKTKSIGTVNPIDDYKLCLSSDKQFNEIAQEMTNAIETLFYSNSDQHKSKATDAMFFYRAESVRENPTFYNEWLKNFKMELIGRKRYDVIEIIEEKNMDFIYKYDNTLSQIESIEEMCGMDTCNLADVAISSDIREFFGNM